MHEHTELKDVFLSLGSNVSVREDFLRRAYASLTQHTHITVVGASSFYETKPQGCVLTQRNFINAVVQIRTSLSAYAMLDFLQSIETGLGRVRTVVHGPRTIDIDILSYGSDVQADDRLVIPHRFLHERFFVLCPLVEIAPAWQHPLIKQTAQELLAMLRRQKGDEVRFVRKLAAENIRAEEVGSWTLLQR